MYTWRCCLGERRAPTEDCLLDEGYEAAPEGATRVAAAGNAFFAELLFLSSLLFNIFNILRKKILDFEDTRFQDRLKLRNTYIIRGRHTRRSSSWQRFLCRRQKSKVGLKFQKRL